MRRPGFEPGFWAWKAQVIATRPSTHKATHLEVFVTYNVFAWYMLFLKVSQIIYSHHTNYLHL